LAVLVASPCTAPFMAAAIGAALVMPAPATLAVFAALGLGLAAPTLILALAPGLASRLPRPGPWMLRFKQFMAFPMLATVIWLLWVLGQQSGIDGAAGLLLLLLLLALLLWTLGLPRGRSRLIAPALALLALLGGLWWAGPQVLRMQAATADAAAGAGAVRAATSTSPATRTSRAAMWVIRGVL
jgi:thiol:disulfide interchange protein DsbD